MRKNKFLLCLVLIGVLCFCAITAYAVGVDDDYVGGSTDTSQSSSGTNLYPSPYFDGIRVSFVKGDGTTVASKTYIDDSQYNSNSSLVVKTTNNCSYPAISNGKCSVSWNGGASLSSVTRPVSEFEDLFKDVTADDGSKHSFSVSIASKVASSSFTGMFDGISKEKSPLSEEEYSKFIYALFNRMLSSLGSSQKVDNFVIDGEANKLYDLFIVFEPVSVVKLNGLMYLGTSHELAIQGSKTKGGKTKDENGVPYCSSTSTALCDLGSVLRRTIPCKSYLDGNIINSMKEKQSTILIKNFPDGYYFNNIRIDYSTASGTCSSSKKNLTNDFVTGNYSVGIGVIWLSDLYEGNEGNCEEIKAGITWDWESSFKTNFEKNGVQGIYDAFASYVSSEYPYGYIAYNNGTEKADLKWFVNQCTCYGIYEHYAKNNIATYQAQNQSSINQISGTFGSSDWFKVPQISETKGWLINSKFNSGSFTAFNNEMQAYSDANELKWTPWTGEYYNEVLKCGTKEEYWCEEFETWYEEMRTQYSGLRSYPTISTIKNSSLAVINARYKEQLQTMIDAYNLNFYPANGFRWTLDATDSGTNFSYIKNCISADTASCQTVINFYQQNEGTDLNDLACDRLESFDFSAYNNRYGTDITGQWFVSTCGCTQATSYNCTPNYSVGSCTNNDDIVYTDSSNGVIEDEYWENCVFNDYGDYEIDPHKVSDHGSELTYYEDGLGSQYCEVYCIEDLSGSLAKPNINVEAGSRFTWGYSQVKGSRTCKTKTVEWDKFIDDLEQANQDIADAYVDWQVEIKMDKITWKRASKKDCAWSCDSYGYRSCGTKEKPRQCRYCKRGSYKDYTYTPSSTHESHSVYGEFSSSASDSTSTVCGASSIPTWNPAAKKSIYEDAIDYAQSLIEDMKKCYTWDQSTVYEVDPQATIIYSDDINYYYKDELDKTTSYSFRDESICISDKAYPIKSCSGTRCPTTAVTMKNCSGDDRYVQMTRRATTRFLLKDNVYRYVLKSNHLSIHSADLGSGESNQGYLSNGTYVQGLEHVDIDSNFTINYIDIGFSNFPVSYSAPEGVYGSKENQGQFDVEYSNLGHVQSGKTDIDTIMSGGAISQGTGEEYGKWVCEYRVYADLLPEDPGGSGGNPGGGVGDIDLIYRPIDLYNPFPDIDASHRDTGANWCDQSGDCSYDNYSVQTYIYENRNVSYDEVYSLEPMYTFVLTPAIIKEIREYNDTNSYASYTGSLGTAQYFDYVCEEGTGQACVSDYLSYIIDITGAKNQPGTCVADKFRNANDVESFYGCRY